MGSLLTDTDLPAGTKDPEDIPTFDEWKRKMMEVEKEQSKSRYENRFFNTDRTLSFFFSWCLSSVAMSTQPPSNGGPPALKKVPKNFNNYASVECGAKILGANTEAKVHDLILLRNCHVLCLMLTQELL